MNDRKRSWIADVFSNAFVFWGGHLGVVGGIAVFAYAVYAYLVIGRLWVFDMVGGLAIVIIGGFAIFYAWDDRRHRPTMERWRKATMTRIVVEFPVVRDPAEARQHWIDPLCRFVEDEGMGKVTSVDAGYPGTPDEFSPRVTIEVHDRDKGLDDIARTLEVLGACDAATIEVHEPEAVS